MAFSWPGTQNSGALMFTIALINSSFDLMQPCHL